jgi:hypothetical protein
MGIKEIKRNGSIFLKLFKRQWTGRGSHEGKVEVAQDVKEDTVEGPGAGLR